MLQPERSDFDPVIRCREGQKELKGIPVGFDGIVAYSFDMGEVVIEELMETWGKLHDFLFCHRAKSTKALRLAASATRRYTLVCLYSLWPI